MQTEDQKNFKKGFSLIELIVVTAIVGILSSVILTTLSAARAYARDSHRISDMRQVQQMLQLFYLKCGFYPGKYWPDMTTFPFLDGCYGGRGNVVSDDGADDQNRSIDFHNPNGWGPLPGSLEFILKQSEIGVSSIPHDPLNPRNYQYHVQLRLPENTTLPGQNPPRAQCYVLETHLETDHSALHDETDLDPTDLKTKLPPIPVLANGNNPCVPGANTGEIGKCKNLFPPRVFCEDEFVNGPNFDHGYCIGNIECFHD